MLTECIQWLLSDFGLAMFFLSVFMILFHLIIRPRHVSLYEIIYRWTALFALGLTGVYTFIMHAFFSETAAAAIGWATSPFQFEVAVADLALGILGIVSFRASLGFRAATVIAAVCMLWGDAAGHVYQMIVNQNFAPGNAGSWFWLDLFIPFLLLVCVLKLKPAPRRL